MCIGIDPPRWHAPVMLLDCLQDLFMKLHPLGEGFRLQMEAGMGEIFIEVVNAKALGHSHPVVIIHAITQTDLERPDGPEDVGPEKDCRLADEADFTQTLEIEGLSIVTLDDLAGRVHMIPLTIEHAHISMRLEKLDDLPDRP